MPDLDLIREIEKRIDQDHDVTIRDGVVTSEPCLYNHGYGKSKRKKAERVAGIEPPK